VLASDEGGESGGRPVRVPSKWKLRMQVLALESRHGQGSCVDRLPKQPSHKDARLTR
jgi:hypothetical protein